MRVVVMCCVGSVSRDHALRVCGIWHLEAGNVTHCPSQGGLSTNHQQPGLFFCLLVTLNTRRWKFTRFQFSTKA
jgi:hypothetical protein